MTVETEAGEISSATGVVKEVTNKEIAIEDPIAAPDQDPILHQEVHLQIEEERIDVAIEETEGAEVEAIV